MTAVTDTLADAAVVAGASAGDYDVDVAPGWTVGGKPNGGYLTALTCAAVLAELGVPDPVGVQATFVAVAEPGDATVRVAAVRSGRVHSHATATLAQRGKPRLLLTGVCGTLSSRRGVTRYGPRREVAALDDCPPVGHITPDGIAVPLAERVQLRLDPSTAGWIEGRPSTGPAEIGGWLRIAGADSHPALAALIACDALPPTVWTIGMAGWVPTVQMSVALHALPKSEWLQVWASTPHLCGGYLRQDVEVWDGSRLVAEARHLSLVPTRALR